MAQFTYHFSSNGSLDDWNWEVSVAASHRTM
jgi:hypothetical protein